MAAAAVTAKPWGAHDTRLTLVTLGAIAIIVLLIVVVKMHPFLALIAGSAFIGLAGGMSLPAIIVNFERVWAPHCKKSACSSPSAPCSASCSPTPGEPTGSSTSC